MPRTDAHRPAALITEDYELVTYFDFQDPQPTVVGPNANGQYFTIDISPAERAARARIKQLLADSPEHRDSGTCDHCGAHIRYTAILRYTPTGGHISVGEQCMDNRFSSSTAEFQAMRKAAELDRKGQRIKHAVAQFCLDNPDLAWMASMQESWVKAGMSAEGVEIPGRKPNWFVLDISHKLRKYGEISERQVAAVRASLVKDAEWAEKRAQWAAERAAADEGKPKAAVPAGRQDVTGTILSVKEVEDQFSAGGSRYSRYSVATTWKMLVEDDRGFKVFGTIPSAVLEARSGPVDELKGQRVSFAAELEPSKPRADANGDVATDPYFGFFRRPTKARLLTQAPALVAAAPAGPRSYAELFGDDQ